MFVEDIVSKLVNEQWFLLTKIDKWSRTFLLDIHDRCALGRALSTNQGRVVLRILSQLGPQMTDVDADELADVLNNPEYRMQPYESGPPVLREVRYLGDNLLGFRFKPNAMIRGRLADISKPVVYQIGRSKSLGYTPIFIAVRNEAIFDWTYKIWIVPVHHGQTQAIRALIKEQRFDADNAVHRYLDLCDSSVGQRSSFVLHDDNVLVGVVRDNLFLAHWMTQVAPGIVL
jgi:hypothetical protein